MAAETDTLESADKIMIQKEKQAGANVSLFTKLEKI